MHIRLLVVVLAATASAHSNRIERHAHVWAIFRMHLIGELSVALFWAAFTSRPMQQLHSIVYVVPGPGEFDFIVFLSRL